MAAQRRQGQGQGKDKDEVGNRHLRSLVAPLLRSEVLRVRVQRRAGACSKTHTATGPARNDTVVGETAGRQCGMWLTALMNPRPLASRTPAKKSGVSQCCASRAPEVSAGAATEHRIAGKAHLAEDTQKEPQGPTTDCTSKPLPFSVLLLTGSCRPARAIKITVP